MYYHWLVRLVDKSQKVAEQKVFFIFSLTLICIFLSTTIETFLLLLIKFIVILTKQWVMALSWSCAEYVIYAKQQVELSLQPLFCRGCLKLCHSFTDFSFYVMLTNQRPYLFCYLYKLFSIILCWFIVYFYFTIKLVFHKN